MKRCLARILIPAFAAGSLIFGVAAPAAAEGPDFSNVRSCVGSNGNYKCKIDGKVIYTDNPQKWLDS